MGIYVNEVYRVVTAVIRESDMGGWTDVTAVKIGDPENRIECVREPTAKVGDNFVVARKLTEG